MEFNPKKITIEDFESNIDIYGQQFHIHDNEEPTQRLDCFGRFVKGSKKLVCLMPSALPGNKEKPEAVFHRWSWSHHIEENVISLNDPTFSIPEVFCGWFIGRGDADVINVISDKIKRIASKLKVDTCDMIFYGSSMGGFGSIMMASLNKGALALAEVPQLDLREYPLKSTIRDLEKFCLNGESLGSYAKYNAHQVSVIERFVKEKNVPNIKIITNTADIEYAATADFLKSLHSVSKQIKSHGRVELCILPEPIGHRPLPTAIGVKIIKDELARLWGDSSIVTMSFENHSNQINKDSREPINNKPDYKQILEEAIELSKKIKFIRTDADKQVYEETLELLYEASELNKLADWPLLKICSIEKQWTNSFNNRILEAAIDALARRETLEGFIYCCRGYLYNYSAAEAARAITNLTSACGDEQIANVGNIFKAILSYNLEDYTAYSKLIATFNQRKACDFNPYIAIPAASVFTGNDFAPAEFNAGDAAIGGKKILIADIPENGSEYIISISCDQKYFSLYGEYIVKSFTRHCSNEAALHISLLDGEIDFYSYKIKEWGGCNIFYTVNGIESEVNKGPIASMLRFLSVYPLMEKYSLPVLVLDLDTVIKRSFNELVVMMDKENLDILSRVLENGMAPWEKYTGGFAFFGATENGKSIARNIAYIGGLLCKTDESQWWIDQNIFEAAIRERIINKKNLKLKNIFNIRDSYCVMPVGSTESKTYSLNNALKLFG